MSKALTAAKRGSEDWKRNGAAGANIVVFGAGKSATCLIDYLISVAGVHHWLLTVADNDLAVAQQKVGDHPHARAVSVDVENTTDRNALISSADIVISLLPPTLHFLVAQDCVLFQKNLLTASYTDERIKSLQPEIEAKKLLFLCEMGLDPGIDHMSAMQLVHRIKAKGGVLTSFYSHCGGLVAPESDDNPWHYKISWNPRNVVMAGKSGAVYRQENTTQTMPYVTLFDYERVTTVPGLGNLSWYPNRDSLAYIPIYGLEGINTFVRTTLRYPAFCYGWKKLIEAGLTDETRSYETDGMTLQDFFALHFKSDVITGSSGKTDDLAKLFAAQLNYLGAGDNKAMINRGRCSALDVLQFALESKLVLQSHDKDMIVMLHEIEYLLDGKKFRVKSSLVVKGDDNLRTAMAKTVGLPMAIATRLILLGKITATGLHIPVSAALYEPVLNELQAHGIRFEEKTIAL